MCWCTPGLSERECYNPWCSPPKPPYVAVLTLREKIEELANEVRKKLEYENGLDGDDYEVFSVVLEHVADRLEAALKEDEQEGGE